MFKTQWEMGKGSRLLHFPFCFAHFPFLFACLGVHLKYSVLTIILLCLFNSKFQLLRIMVSEGSAGIEYLNNAISFSFEPIVFEDAKTSITYNLKEQRKTIREWAKINLVGKELFLPKNRNNRDVFFKWNKGSY